MGQAMTEYEARHGNTAPRSRTANGMANVVLSCKCGTTIEVELYDSEDSIDWGTWPHYDVPEGWYVDLVEKSNGRLVRGSTVVRCPRHRTLV